MVNNEGVHPGKLEVEREAGRREVMDAMESKGREQAMMQADAASSEQAYSAGRNDGANEIMAGLGAVQGPINGQVAPKAEQLAQGLVDKQIDPAQVEEMARAGDPDAIAAIEMTLGSKTRETEAEVGKVMGYLQNQGVPPEQIPAQLEQLVQAQKISPDVANAVMAQIQPQQPVGDPRMDGSGAGLGLGQGRQQIPSA